MPLAYHQNNKINKEKKKINSKKQSIGKIISQSEQITQVINNKTNNIHILN